MILKYDTGVGPFRGKKKGAVFQTYASGQQAMSLKRNGRYRYPNQFDSSGILIILTRGWRNLSSAQKTAWNDFAAAYPQPTIHNPAKFLPGYQNFIRRNYFELLFKGRDTSLITNPVLAEYPELGLDVAIGYDGNPLHLTVTSDNSNDNYLIGYFVSNIKSPGINYPRYGWRYMNYSINSGGSGPILGYIYPWYTGNDARSVANTGWHVPTVLEFLSLRSSVGSTTAGKQLKETGTT